jgi:outer membrane protein assembly factor BamB
MPFKQVLSHAALVGLLVVAHSAHAGETFNGWRGNATGIWADAKPPIEWHRIPKGAMEGLRATVKRPAGTQAGDAPLVSKGLIRDWLVVGPFAVKDAIQDFDQDPLKGEAEVQPTSGDKVGEREWKPASVPPDDIMVFGTAELAWLDLAKAIGFQRNQLAYAHTYLYSPRGGPARIVVDHAHGLKAWLNGREVYRSPQRGIGLGFYTAISAHELRHLDQPSPRFDLELRPGWNRLLLKLSTPNNVGHTDMRCALRIMDPPSVSYDTKNILWMTPLPHRSTSTPIIVGDRLFVLAEPDELLCLDKISGRVLWTAAVNYYEALSPDERKANPAFATKVDPLVEELRRATDRLGRVRLRAKIRKTLLEIDEKRFAIHANDHFEAHFGIVGFTMPTPVSDGKHVYVWNGMGIAACFDLEGTRQWITRVKTDHLSYGSSPALADGVLATFLDRLYGFDAKTGKLLWQQPRVQQNVASILAAKLAGQSVFVTQRGEVIRVSDGELLFRPRGYTTGDTGWAPPVLLGDTMYLPRYGVNQLNVLDFSHAPAERWQPKTVATITVDAVTTGAGGKWIDRWTAGSPLIWDGMAYEIDIYHTFYAVDLKSGKTLYRRELDLQGFMHYNSVPVAASPTLVGKHVLVCDNQGTTIVLEHGRRFEQVARNHIGTQIERTWPVPAQETLCYAPPLADGNRLYLRGEAYLYCISEK